MKKIAVVGLLLFLSLFVTLVCQDDSEITGAVVDSQEEDNSEEVSEEYLETLKSLGYIN